jgi:hypothetical protein
MFCPKCGKELPDGSQFCLKCGHALTADAVAQASAQPAQKKAGLSALQLVGVGLLILLLVMLWARNTASPIASRTITNPLAPAVVPMSKNLFTGQIIVKAGGTVTNTFTVEPGLQNFHVVGQFNASGGLTNDIQAVLADEGEFQNWINGHQAKTCYATGLTTTGKLDVGALAPGRYVLAFSNKTGLVDRQLFAEVEARWTAQR